MWARERKERNKAVQITPVGAWSVTAECFFAEKREKSGKGKEAVS
jgi:hypothetical protein